MSAAEGQPSKPQVRVQPPAAMSEQRQQARAPRDRRGARRAGKASGGRAARSPAGSIRVPRSAKRCPLPRRSRKRSQRASASSRTVAAASRTRSRVGAARSLVRRYAIGGDAGAQGQHGADATRALLFLLVEIFLVVLELLQRLLVLLATAAAQLLRRARGPPGGSAGSAPRDPSMPLPSPSRAATRRSPQRTPGVAACLRGGEQPDARRRARWPRRRRRCAHPDWTCRSSELMQSSNRRRRGRRVGSSTAVRAVPGAGTSRTLINPGCGAKHLAFHHRFPKNAPGARRVGSWNARPPLGLASPG